MVFELIIVLCLVGFCSFLAAVSAFFCWRAGKRTAWRRLAQPFPRCISCGYAMKGLTEARCPECGTRYTLDGLWMAQRDLITDDAEDRCDPH